jgi:hypothetical protein
MTMMNRLRDALVVAALGMQGCADRNVPPPPPERPSADTAAKAAPPTSPKTADTPAPKSAASPPHTATPPTPPTTAAVPAPPKTAAAPAPAKTASASAPPAKAPPAPPKAPAAAARTEPKPAEPQQAAAPLPPPSKPKPAPLDLRTLEQRLKDTGAIGVLTKLSLKNQVDDLVAKFRAYHGGARPPTLPELRPAYELLLMKVLSLLQDKDTGLAHDIDASREAIWGVLSDRSKFEQFT